MMIKNKSSFFLLTCIVCSLLMMLLLSSNSHISKQILYRRPQLPARDVLCHKNNEFDSYITCDSKLPYTNTDCQRTFANENRNFLVPNIVHFVWFGDMELKYYQYLAIRSAAANQKPEVIMFHVNGSKPRGEFWDRAESEIPCLRVMKIEAPTSVMGQNISLVLHQTDIARLNILLKYGGIYVDSDALILRSMDPLRMYPFTIGRSTENSLSNGVMLSEPNSEFVRKWLNMHRTFNKNKVRGIHLADYSIKLPFHLHLTSPYSNSHVEETSMQRPNPWIDGRACISHDSFNISNNFILHLHPQKSLLRDPRVLLTYRENELRLYDATYGAGARAALFGTQDLIFLESETSVHNRKTAMDIKQFRPMTEFKSKSFE